MGLGTSVDYALDNIFDLLDAKRATRKHRGALEEGWKQGKDFINTLASADPGQTELRMCLPKFSVLSARKGCGHFPVPGTFPCQRVSGPGHFPVLLFSELRPCPHPDWEQETHDEKQQDEKAEHAKDRPIFFSFCEEEEDSAFLSVTNTNKGT